MDVRAGRDLWTVKDKRQTGNDVRTISDVEWNGDDGKELSCVTVSCVRQGSLMELEGRIWDGTAKDGVIS